MYVCAGVYMHILNVCMCIVYIYVYIHTLHIMPYVRIYIYTLKYMLIGVYTYIYIYMYIVVYMHIGRAIVTGSFCWDWRVGAGSCWSRSSKPPKGTSGLRPGRRRT